MRASSWSTPAPSNSRPPSPPMLRQKTQAPVHTAIYTHGHIDHAYGLEAFLMPGQKRPRVIAHRAMPARFARYAATARHNAALNARQFGGTVEAQAKRPMPRSACRRSRPTRSMTTG